MAVKRSVLHREKGTDYVLRHRIHRGALGVFHLEHADLLAIDVIHHAALRKARELRQIHWDLAMAVQHSPGRRRHGSDNGSGHQCPRKDRDNEAQTQSEMGVHDALNATLPP